MASSSSGSMIPGRSALKKRPIDPKQGRYERSRARDSYKRQLNIFKAKFEANLREYDRLDFDAKQAIRIRAKRQREICLNDYRQGLLGLARSSFRRTYKDIFLGERETSIESLDPNVLEYELRLTSEMDTIIDNIRLLCVDKSNLSKMDWFSNLARAKFSYEFDQQNQIDTETLSLLPDPKESNDNENIDELQSNYDGINESEIDPEIASTIGSSGYVYRPFRHRNRHNLYRSNVDEPDPTEYNYDWQRLYDSKPEHRTIPEYETESLTDHYDYEPFQPFSDEPIGLRRNRYPNSSLDPEWQSKSSVYSYHRPKQPIQRFGPNRFDLNLDSICPTYGYGNENADDGDKETITSEGMMAGIDYEYKPIIPSYIRNGNHSKGSSSNRFNYGQHDDNDDNDDYEPSTTSWQPEPNNLLSSERRRRRSQQSLSMEPQFSSTTTSSLSSAQPFRSHVRFDDDDNDNQPIKSGHNEFNDDQ